jgi:crossover junction endodeoxyribonuclease RuvC
MIIGIDPGITGAIAFLSAEPRLGVAVLEDMPTMQRGKTGAKQQINGRELARIFNSMNTGTPRHVYLEHVMGAPRKSGGGSVMGAASAFNFGHSFGVIQGVLGALEIPYTLVTPSVWKKRANLIGAEKDMSRTRAIELYPKLADELARKKDVGRAEALLIAIFGPSA